MFNFFYKEKKKKLAPEDQTRLDVINNMKAELCAELDELIIEVRHWENVFTSSVGAYQGSEYLHRFINDEEVKNNLIAKIHKMFNR